MPFLLIPVGKDYLWGGNRLNDDFSKEIRLSPLAETWECSTHPDGESMVRSGIFSGMTLTRVLKAHPEFLGSRRSEDGQLPVMVKFIDASNDLSVQVHPDDDYAGKYENGQRGKSEMWYVIDATADASLIYGLTKTLTGRELAEKIDKGELERYLQRVPVKKNDVFFIEAGTIHAIGAGALVAEVQESSNLTYRLYDYDRRDKNGCKRPLHIEKALEVAKLEAANVPRQPMRVLKYEPGLARELLCRCKYFEVYRMLINTERCRNMASYSCDSGAYGILLCIEGCGTIHCDDYPGFSFFKGDCIFVPATSGVFRIHGRAQFLDIHG